MADADSASGEGYEYCIPFASLSLSPTLSNRTPRIVRGESVRACASALWCGELAANGPEVARLTMDVLRKGNHD